MKLKLTILLMTVTALHVSAGVLSQTVSYTGKNVTLQEVFREVKKQTGYTFIYNSDLLDKTKPLSISVTNMMLEAFLTRVLSNQQLDFTIRNTTVFIFHQTLPATPAPKQIAASPPPSDSVTGLIKDTEGRPLRGASIVIKGTANSTSTNNKGAFSIKANAGDLMVISYVGYDTREISITAAMIAEKSIAFSLAVNNNELNQVQVIAYGTTTKRMNTGDVTTITAKDIEKNPVNNVLEAVQGHAPGLFVQQVTGQPDGAFNLRLRGAANFQAGAPQPLIVVDGVRYPGGKLPMSNSSYGTVDFLQGGSGLNFINPQDIESINILKDADATALYGSSGAYGVILITTKKAKLGDASSLSANVYTGTSVLGSSVKLMNTEQYLMIRREAIKNDGLTVTPDDKDLNGTWPETRYNDYKKDLLGGRAQTTNASVNYMGGTKYASYLINGSFKDNGNIQRHKGKSRNGSIRFSLNTNSADNKLSFSISGSFMSAVNNMVPTDFSSSVIYAAPNGPALFSPDGSINWETGHNDLADDINRIYKNITNNLLSNFTISYKPVQHLTLRSIIAYSEIFSKEFMGFPTTTKAPAYVNAAAETHSEFHHYDVRTVTFSPYAEYNINVGSKGDLDLKTGGILDNKLTYTDKIHGVGFASDALLSNPSAGATVTAEYTETPYRALGFHAVAKFSWDQKYIINLNARRDGSTKFGSGKKFGNFGSVAVAWIFSEEKLIKDKLPFLSYGKLRASTGVIGGDAVGDLSYLRTYSVINGSYQGKNGLTTSSFTNPNLSWEKNKNSEIGLELGFMNGRIYVEGNFYRNIASNQLISMSLPTVTGFSGYPINSNARIRTSGWELALNTNNIKTKDFNWSTRVNISIPRSKLVRLPEHKVLDKAYIVNKPVTGVLLYKYNGINPQTGYYNFTDATGKTDDFTGDLTNDDKTEFLDLAPKYYGGVQNSFSYKQFSFDFSIAYTSRVGKNFLAQTGYPIGYIGLNGGTDWLNRWQKPGDITDMPRVSTQLITQWARHILFQESTGAYSNATYARLQNVSIRYALKPGYLKRLRIKDMSVYLQGQNLLTVSKYGGLDPENLDAATIPPMRVFTAGLNISL